MTRYGPKQIEEANQLLQAPFASPQVDCLDLGRVVIGDTLCLFNEGDTPLQVTPDICLPPHDAVMLKEKSAR